MNERYLFRAWDKTYKEMVYSGLGRNHHMAMGFDGKIYDFEYDEHEAEGGDVCVFPERFIPMQCTGLPDKNGKLMYESDVVRYINAYDFIGVVSWEVNSWMVSPIDVSDGDCAEEMSYPADCYEVLGNIHEGMLGGEQGE